MSIEKGDATKYVHTGNGELCYELSEMEQERTFPMSDEGRAAMQQWLEENIAPIEPKTAE